MKAILFNHYFTNYLIFLFIFSHYRELVELFEKSNKCWPLKHAIVLFFYHIYLDTEKEMKEEIE